MSAPNRPVADLRGLRRAYRALCDRCGKKYFNWQLKEEWTGLMVCHGPETDDCWEARHEQDFVRGRKETYQLPWTRPEPEDVTAYTNICTPIKRIGGADVAVADCMTADSGFAGMDPQEYLDYYVCNELGKNPHADYAEADCVRCI